MQVRDNNSSPSRCEVAIMAISLVLYLALAYCALFIPLPEGHHKAGWCYLCFAVIQAVPLRVQTWLLLLFRKRGS